MGLAPMLVDQVFEIIKEINRQGVTILLVEQNAYAALEIADQAYVLASGEISMAGSGAELLQHEEVISAYLGEG
jgi:branched-chain amino acid transport system ATP-binding protein